MVRCNEKYEIIYKISLDCNKERGFDLPVLISNLDKKKLIQKAKTIQNRNENFECLFYSEKRQDFINISVSTNININFWITFLTLKEHNMTLEFTKNYIKKNQ